jgi:hypothetical protein
MTSSCIQKLERYSSRIARGLFHLFRRTSRIDLVEVAMVGLANFARNLNYQTRFIVLTRIRARCASPLTVSCVVTGLHSLEMVAPLTCMVFFLFRHPIVLLTCASLECRSSDTGQQGASRLGVNQTLPSTMSVRAPASLKKIILIMTLLFFCW